MRLSIVILTWNSASYINTCLQTLLESLADENQDYEIFVVDNGSDDGSQGVIDTFQQQFPDIIKPIFLKSNTGTTYSRNLALKQAKGDYIAVLDSDVVLPKDIWQPLLEELDRGFDIGMVVPKLVYANGKFQKSTDDFPTILTKVRRYFFLKNMEEAEGERQTIKKCCVDYAISAFWLMKKEVVERVGLLDEKIFYAPEDVDYCLRIWKAGYKIQYLASNTVIHDAQEISRGLRLNKSFFEHLKGLAYYFKKHGYWFRRPHYNSRL